VIYHLLLLRLLLAIGRLLGKERAPSNGRAPSCNASAKVTRP
jgi:hypothetical protein